MRYPIHSHVGFEVVVDTWDCYRVHERPALYCGEVLVVAVLLQRLEVFEYPLALLLGSRCLCILLLKVLNGGTRFGNGELASFNHCPIYAAEEGVLLNFIRTLRSGSKPPTFVAVQ